MKGADFLIWWKQMGFAVSRKREPTANLSYARANYGSRMLRTQNKKTPKRCLIVLVGTNGLEPSTSCMSSKRSNQLSYAPISCIISIFKLLGKQFSLAYHKKSRRLLPSAFFGGDKRIRTAGLFVANEPLYQLSHIPVSIDIL